VGWLLIFTEEKVLCIQEAGGGEEAKVLASP